MLTPIHPPVVLNFTLVNLVENLDVVVVALLFYVHSKHLRSCRDGQLT